MISEDNKAGKGLNLLNIIEVLVVAKVLYSIFNRDDLINEKIDNTNNSEGDISKGQIDNTDNSEYDVIDVTPPKVATNYISLNKSKQLGKNKWLYPTDNFGIMENGTTESIK
ncbi:MAG: hypothetical protein L0Y61_02435 [Epsilonproteobacteria bacterium]|nr:hypothetical protein [Campylobacterota bacterium]